MSDPSQTIRNTIRGLLKRRTPDGENTVPTVDDDADLYDDLEMDSLEVAELSASLGDDLGKDPYSDGQAPRTVAELLDYYDD